MSGRNAVLGAYLGLTGNFQLLLPVPDLLPQASAEFLALLDDRIPPLFTMGAEGLYDFRIVDAIELGRPSRARHRPRCALMTGSA